MPDTPDLPRPSRQVDRPSSADTGQAQEDTANTAGRPSADPDLREGARPVPEYVLVHKLGEGGFGQVWKARDDNGLEVALKFLRRDPLAGDSEVRELEVMKKVGHANLLVLHRYWRLGGWLAVALELAGGTLLDRYKAAKEQGQVGIPAEELLEYMREAAKGLDYLHSRSILHRDVKPQNLLLVGGSVKVADFGLAKLAEQSLAAHSGGMTLAYAAPEQFQGRVSPHSDQYSLAVSYCQLRGGRLPFKGGQHELYHGHLHSEPDLSMLPEAERPAVAKALAKKPEQRWPSCREFVHALAVAISAGTPTDPTPTLRTTAPYRLPRSRWYAIGGLVLLGILFSGLALRLFLPGTERVTAEAPSHPELGPVKENATVSEKKPVSGAASRPDRPPAAEQRRPQLLDCTGEAGISVAEMRRAQQAWAKHLGRQVEETVELADGVTMTFVLVPPGKFRMGSPEDEASREEGETLHTVLLTEPFDLCKYEVTQAQYKALTGKEPSHFKGSGDLPVETVSWNEARDYGAELTKKRSDRLVYRLPTEAEWEYACRGGRPSSQPFGIGGGWTLSSRQANFNGKNPAGSAEQGDYLERTCKVGSYAANALGLYDMHGNVWEWCADQYGPYPGDELTNPTGPAEGPLRVRRGGGWGAIVGSCRAALRYRSVPVLLYNTVGFRLARSVPPGGK